jgi:hypothetical protein
VTVRVDVARRYGWSAEDMARALNESADQYERWEAENVGAHVRGCFAAMAATYRAEASEWAAAALTKGEADA